MKLGIDFKAVGTKVAGHAIGAAAYTQLNKASFMQKQTKPLTKGLITALIGYVGVPLAAKKLKLGGGKSNLVEHIGEGMGMVGIMQVAGAQFPGKDGQPGLFPTISGYEENPIMGLGDTLEDYDNMSGYEDNPTVGANDAASGDPAAY